MVLPANSGMIASSSSAGNRNEKKWHDDNVLSSRSDKSNSSTSGPTGQRSSFAQSAILLFIVMVSCLI